MADPATLFHDFEQGGWERAAAQYDAGFQRLTAQSIEPLLDAVRCGPGTRFVDLASGPGYVAVAAAERGSSAVGIDFSAAMVALGRHRHPRIELLVGDAEALTLPDRSADAAVMAYGLLHLARPDRALAEALRILRPGGRFAATVWAAPQRALGFSVILDAVRAHGRLEVPLPAGPPFFRFSDHAEFRRSLEAVGFDEVETIDLAQLWRLHDAEAFCDAMQFGTVRTGALLAAQSPAELAHIRTAVVDRCRSFQDAEGLLVPMPAVLARGRRPAR